MSDNQQEEPEWLDPYNPVPDVLYTFSSLEYIDDLKAGRLWFSPISSYNDIHENTVFTRDMVTDDFSLAWEAEDLINEWLDSQVVRCFTTDPTNTLMWSHYANSHRGVCVGYRLKHIRAARYDDIAIGDYPIRYSSTPPLSLVSGPNTPNTILHLAEQILLTKSIDWAYEKEHRFSVKLPEMAKAGGGLIDIGAGAVADVIFGAKVDREIVEEQCRKLPEGVRPRKAEHNSRALSYNLQIRDL